MTAYNIVRFTVKSGQEEAFLDAHKKSKPVAGMLDSFRNLLEDQGNGLGLTGAVSVPVVLELQHK